MLRSHGTFDSLCTEVVLMMTELSIQRNGSTDLQAPAISAGAILVPADMVLPEAVHVRVEKCNSWKVLAGVNGDEFESRMRAAGWHFSYLVPPAVKVRAFGLTRLSAVHNALERTLETATSRRCNALEFSEVKFHQALGLTFVTVQAQPRHVGPGPFLHTLDLRKYPEDVQDFGQIFWRAARVEPEIKGI